VSGHLRNSASFFPIYKVLFRGLTPIRPVPIRPTNTVYKQWARIFNNDATLTTAILDRLVHHCETVTIEGKSYRMKDKEPGGNA